MDIKKVLSLTLITLTYYVGASQTFVPDVNFEQALIDLGYDTGPLDGFVPTANISGITDLDIENKNISDLTGIEDFAALTYLNCDNNNLTNLNITQNINLTQLYCQFNQLTTLNTALNTNLNILWAKDNQLNGVDISNNTRLISLITDNNPLYNLDVTNNINLTVLSCENNQLTTLDLTENTTLNRIQCGNNLLSNLDVSNNPDISIFTCENNQLTALDLSNNTNLSVLNCSFNQLSELDVSNNPNLTTLDCSNNNLCRLNLKNGNNMNAIVDFSANLNLNCVVVDNPSNNHSTWIPTNFSNYVSSQNDCSNFVDIDTLNNVITNSSYALPVLTYGNYYTEPQAHGTPLFPGHTITSSQTIYIYNESLCASNESRFYVLITDDDYYIPKYFTPNNDGNHDVWNVQDFTNTIKTISIFDRYGKLLKSLLPNSEGWNGTFNGQPLENNDYWYAITLNTGEIIKGHFTLKR